MEKKEFDLFDLAAILLKNRVFIIVFVLVVSIAAVIYSLVTPVIWSSEATFYAVGESSSGLPFNVPGLGGLTSAFLNTGGGEASMSMVTALRSRQFSEDVIRKFNLIEYFEISKPDSLASMDRALKALRQEMLSVGYDEETSLIRISIESKSKKLSRSIVEYYLEKLDKYNREQKLTKGRRNREFLESRVISTRAEIDSLLLAVRDFQSRNKAIDLEAQSTALIGSYSDIVAKKMQSDIELQLARQNYSSDSPIIRDLETTNSELVRQIRSMEAGGGSLKPQYLIDISKLPDLASQYAQLKLNLEIKGKVFEYLYPQYEAARLEELKDMPTLDILDSPREAGLRVRPRRAIICIISAILAFVVASLIAIIKNVLEKNSDRIREIRQSL